MGTWLDKIRHGSHTLGANQDLSGKEGASADQHVIVIVGDLIASNVEGWVTGGESQ